MIEQSIGVYPDVENTTLLQTVTLFFLPRGIRLCYTRGDIGLKLGLTPIRPTTGPILDFSIKHFGCRSTKCRSTKRRSTKCRSTK